MKFYKHKFKVLLSFFILLAVLFGISIFLHIVFNLNLFCLDFTKKYQLISSFGIILSALIASFSLMTNIEISKNKEEFKHLKYLSMQFLVLNRYIDYSTSWIDKLQNGNWKNEESQKENLRLEEFLNEIYYLRKELLSKENSYIYKRELIEDYNLIGIITNIEELYHFKNAYGLSLSTYNDIKESLITLSALCMVAEITINEKLNAFEKDV